MLLFFKFRSGMNKLPICIRVADQQSQQAELRLGVMYFR